jgi:hypothetical protein
VPVGQALDRMIVAGRRECEHAQTQVEDVGLVFLLKDRNWVQNFVCRGAAGSAEGLENRIFLDLENKFFFLNRVPIGQVMDQMIVAGRRECGHA